MWYHQVGNLGAKRVAPELTFGWNGGSGFTRDRLGHARAHLSVSIQVRSRSRRQAANQLRHLGWGYWIVEQGRTPLVTLVW